MPRSHVLSHFFPKISYLLIFRAITQYLVNKTPLEAITKQPIINYNLHTQQRIINSVKD